MRHEAEVGRPQIGLTTGFGGDDASMTQGAKLDDTMTRRSVITETEENNEKDAEDAAVPF